MLTAVQWMLSKMVSPLWRAADEDEDIFLDSTGSEDIRHLQGSVVTQLCLDYGMIDDAVFFTSQEVLGGMPLKQGDLVNCVAVRGGAEGGWKALRVEKSADAWDDGGRTSLEADSLQLRPLIGTVTSFDRNDGYINQTTYFSRHTLLEGYEPMKGDWVQAQYFINPTEWTTQAHSVVPLRYSRLDQVHVTSVFGSSGVVEDSVFFSLSSVLLPAHYQPSPGDVVNLVMVESTQSLYSWRALCMAPCSQRNVSATPLLQAELLENKEGLDVSDYGQFGQVNIGERHELVFWIQNQGSETHTLKGCQFAGWDSEEQFTLVAVNKSTLLSPRRSFLHKNGSPSSKKQVGDSKEVVKVKRALNEQDPVDGGDVREDVEVEVSPGERLSVVIACLAKSLGSCAELLLLHFSTFSIRRRLQVTVCCENESLLLPSKPYKPIETSLLFNKSAAHVVTVSAPKASPRFSKRRLPNFVPGYPVPKALRDCMEMQSDVLVAEPCLGEVLSPLNMQSRFSALLWLEELHAENEIREFAISGAFLRKGAAHLHLEVLGLAEGRPNLNIGDRVLLKKSERDGVTMEYISYVTEINDEDVSLRVNSDFHQSYVGEPLDVEFSFNRLPMRRCHHALEQTKHFREILFPFRLTLQTPQWTEKWIDEGPVTEGGQESSASVDAESKATQTNDIGGKPISKPIPSKGQFFNPDLNPCQKEAVKMILAGECRPLPYVLFGPPGTGKTITLIEAILQVYHFLPSGRVLVCTPSNSAADLICIRLYYSGFLHASNLARVNASSRPNESIPEVLQSYSKAGEDIRQAAFHRIVVSTCSSAGMFHNVGIQVGHFTHIFLDEAGQATEPESLIPISLMSERDGQIVLAGDPCQLGPVVKSKLASAFGLGVSLIERLMSNPLYAKQDWGYNTKLVTKLIYNYRCHEALLALPSKLFYQGELCFKAPKDVVESLCQWKNLPKEGFPLIFHGVRGTEMREGNNPSWFNPAEAVQVMLYCCQLAKKLSNPVNTSDIGIIAPYRKQCEKIRLLLGKVGLSNIKVGSVEEFQGQEFLVIIMSTVRSNESVESTDLQGQLGFLVNPKRFNVAITRSKALLLIVGNPHILIMDSCFRALLQFCFNNGAYQGCDPPPFLMDAHIAEKK